MKQRAYIPAILKNVGIRSLVASAILFLLAIAATLLAGTQLYHYTKESLLLQGEVNAVRAAREYDIYLVELEHGVLIASNVVNDMLQENKSTDEIMAYLFAETKSSMKVVKDEGFYGWIAGEYCDAEGWVPDEDYVATERPWYTETIADDGEVTFVKPYVDAQTNTIMTTIAVKLEDGVSVLAYDVQLAEIQDISERIASHVPGSYGIVLDKTGTVIAHSNHAELGKNYFEESGTMGAELADDVLREGKQQFEFEYENQTYMVYVEDIEGGWKVVSLINTGVFYRPLTILLSLLVLFMLLEGVIFVFLFLNQSRKNLSISNRNMQISAMADMYVSIYDIDIPHDRIREIRRSDFHILRIGEDVQRSAKGALNEFFDKNVHEDSKSVMDAFLDLNTLDRRLGSGDTVTEEFLDDSGRWCRGRFTVADRDKDGWAVRVLWMIESIDEEKKRREMLERLSETDRMTGLHNRTAGEAKITELLEAGQGGLLMMIDADKFKRINDEFGHDVGDKVIIAMANAVESAIREGDIVMRLGGDEFVVFAPDVYTEKEAEAFIRRICENIVEAKVEELGERRVYVSIGATFCPKNKSMTFAELYKQADSCVYESKREKGNTATFYHGGGM